MATTVSGGTIRKIEVRAFILPTLADSMNKSGLVDRIQDFNASHDPLSQTINVCGGANFRMVFIQV
jgi:hypothetical protein